MAQRTRQRKPRTKTPPIPPISASYTFTQPQAHALGWVQRSPGAGTVYQAAASNDDVMAGWQASINEPNSTWEWERDDAVARTRDLVANNAQAQTAVDQTVAMQVGIDLRYSPRHDLMAQRLGIEKPVASILADEVTKVWTQVSRDALCRFDWCRDQTFGQQVALLAQHLAVDGEALAVLRFEDGELPPGWKWRTSLQVIDPDRLSNPNGRMNGPMPNGNRLINGIETNGRQAVAYWIRNAHPADRTQLAEGMEWERAPVRNPSGRPIVLHIRRKTRAGQMRGISRFVAVLRSFKQLQQYTERELSAAALNALFGASIETSKTAGEAGEMLGLQQLKDLGELRKGFYDRIEPKLSNGSRAVVLAPNDKLNLNAVARHVASYQGFLQTTGRIIAASLGVTGSSFLGDYTSMSFSTWRGEILPAFKLALQDRALITMQCADLVLLAVIEEGIDIGEIRPPADCPRVYENPQGWIAGRWIGPNRGTIDPVGEADAINKRAAAAVSTLEDETLNDNGGDIEGNAGQLAWERDIFARYGLVPTAIRELMGGPMPGAAAPAAPVTPDENTNTGNVAEPPQESSVKDDEAVANAAAE